MVAHSAGCGLCAVAVFVAGSCHFARCGLGAQLVLGVDDQRDHSATLLRLCDAVHGCCAVAVVRSSSGLVARRGLDYKLALGLEDQRGPQASRYGLDHDLSGGSSPQASDPVDYRPLAGALGHGLSGADTFRYVVAAEQRLGSDPRYRPVLPLALLHAPEDPHCVSGLVVRRLGGLEVRTQWMVRETKGLPLDFGTGTMMRGTGTIAVRVVHIAPVSTSYGAALRLNSPLCAARAARN